MQQHDESVMGCSDRRTIGFPCTPSLSSILIKRISNISSCLVWIGVLVPSSVEGRMISSFGSRARCETWYEPPASIICNGMGVVEAVWQLDDPALSFGIAGDGGLLLEPLAPLVLVLPDLLVLGRAPIFSSSAPDDDGEEEGRAPVVIVGVTHPSELRANILVSVHGGFIASNTNNRVFLLAY